MHRSTLTVGVALVLCLAAFPPTGFRAQSPVPAPASTWLATWSVDLKPNAIAANPDDGTLAVIDAGNSAIEILRPGGTHSEFRRGFRDPRCAAFLPDGVLLVGEAGSGTVKGYDTQGRVVLTLGSPHGEFSSPNAIAIHRGSGLAYIVDSAIDTVKVYRLTDGVQTFQFGSSGTGPGQLSFPLSVAVSPSLNEVFVGDSRNRRIAVFDASTGGFLRNIGSVGGSAGDISFVGGLHIDDLHRLYVIESLGGFVQIFDPYGGLVGQIGEHGNDGGQLRTPKAVAIDRYNRLLATSFLDDRIEVWGIDDFDNPVDEDIVVFASALPAHINPNLPSFQIVFKAQGFDPGTIDAPTLRLNGTTAPIADSYRMGAHLSIRFTTSDVLSTLPPDFTGDTVLTLTGSTTDGQHFESEVPVAVVPPVPAPERRTGKKR